MYKQPPVPIFIPLLNASQRRQFQRLAIEMAMIIFNKTDKRETESDLEQLDPITIELTSKMISK